MSTPKRTEGWERRLADFIESRRATPFAWGSHDCCAFTAGAFAAITGRDPMAYHRSYSTELGAARVIREAGGIESIPEAHGAKKQPVAMARRGDVVSVEINGRISLGVCDGANSFFAAPVGLAPVETIKCRSAWRVE